MTTPPTGQPPHQPTVPHQPAPHHATPPQPAPPPTFNYPAYPSALPIATGLYPGYPASPLPQQPYPNYGYPSYPMPIYYPAPVPTAPSPLSNEGPDTQAPPSMFSGRRATALAITLGLLTLIALALAIASPLLNQTTTTAAPNGWSNVYDARPSGDGSWANTSGCDITSQGLDITTADGNDASCALTQSQNTDLVSAGFLFTATLAPAADTQRSEDAYIAVGADAPFVFVAYQDGTFIVCQTSGNCQATPHTSPIAWHADGYVANTIGLRYDATTQQMQALINGQVVHTESATIPSFAPLALGTISGSEAIYTHATLYAPTK